MKKVFVFGIHLLLVTFLYAQSTYQKLQKAYQQFENDAQLKNGIRNGVQRLRELGKTDIANEIEKDTKGFAFA